MAPRSKGIRSGERARRGARGSGRGAAVPTRVELVLERNVQAPAIARSAIAEHCEELGLGGSLRQSLILLVSEVVSNAVRHSEADPQSAVELLATFGEKMIRVSVTDAGVGSHARWLWPISAGESRRALGSRVARRHESLVRAVARLSESSENLDLHEAGSARPAGR
jgi:two-component sensor histidine kinase